MPRGSLLVYVGCAVTGRSDGNGTAVLNRSNWQCLLLAKGKIGPAAGMRAAIWQRLRCSCKAQLQE